MSQPENVALPPPGFDDLTPDEQIDYIEALWDRVSESPENVPVPDWHRELLAERLKAHREDPQCGSSWAEVRRRIEERLRDDG